MAHRRLHRGGHAVGAVVEEAHQLGHQAGHPLGVRPLVDDLVALVVADEDRSRPPAPWIPLQVVLGHHEVEAAQEVRRVGEVKVGGELEDIGHGALVSLDRLPCFRAGLQRLLALGSGDGVVHRDVVALDAVGAPDGTGEGHPPQEPVPAPRRGGEGVPQGPPEFLDPLEDLLLLLVGRGSLEQHGDIQIATVARTDSI